MRIKLFILLVVMLGLGLCYGQGNQNNYGGGAGVAITTVSGLASVSGKTKGTIAVVTDGASATDCTTGAGSTVVVCQYSGSAWAQMVAASSGATAFSALTGSTNSSAAMVCGTGCSIGVSGSGTNTATQSAALSVSGQTGLITFTGITSTNRAKTVRDAADTLLELGGSYTPTGTWTWTSCSGCTWPTFNQSTTGNAATVTTAASTTNSAYSILTAAGTSGSQAPSTIASFTINPSTGAMNVPGALTVASCSGCGSGSGNMSDGSGSSTAGYFPATTTTAHTYSVDTNIDDGHTTASTITFQEPLQIVGSTHGITIPAGTAVSGAASKVVYAVDTTNGYAEVNENNTGLSRVCTAGNSICTITVASGTSAMGTSAISSGTCATTVTTSASGVATTDTIQYTPSTNPQSSTGYAASASGSLYIWAYPTSGNVNFEVCNNSSSSITPGALTLNWRVTR